MFSYHYIASSLSAQNWILLSTRQNTDDDFEQSIKSTRHDHYIARINLFLLEQKAHDRLNLLHERIENLMALVETMDLKSTRRKICLDAIRERESTIAVLGDVYELDIVQARGCVDVLLRQLGELERGVAPKIWE